MSDRVEWPAGRDEDAALIIRTDYDDEQAWSAVKASLMMTWGEEDDRAGFPGRYLTAGTRTECRQEDRTDP
ncbi:hypothetical protein ABT144_05985 [Streptomyces sp. NPDC002039]|uniref:hypothetical protein n=1 Tax=unclassified Streptomyces TaxID=2593676 RepID=UPI00331EB486